MDPSKDYYDTLRVLPSIEPVAIRAVYLALLKKYHPDVYNGTKDEAIKRTKEFNEAYNILGDEKRREKYDRLRAKSSSERRRSDSRRHKAKAANCRNSLTAKQQDAQKKIYQMRAFVAGIIGIVALVLIITAFAGSD
jgi:curved DNA-binding protein CbpA